MAGVLLSPTTDSLISKRNAMYKKRKESPKFRDILRQRCHARIKASRCALLDKFRDIKDDQELHKTFSGILREEVKLLTRNRFGDERPPVIPEEPEEVETPDSWLIEDFEKVLAEEEAVFYDEWNNQIICPLCINTILNHIPSSDSRVALSCSSCKVQFPPVESIEIFQQSIDRELSNHSENCFDPSVQLGLIDDKEVNGLFLICEACGFFSQVL